MFIRWEDRCDPPKGGLIYHVLNGASGRLTMFEDDDDYEAFESVLTEGVEQRVPACLRTA